MKLSKEIFSKILESEDIIVDFPNLKLTADEMVEKKCYNALKKIKTIIENDSLSDFDCVEQIVCVFEDIGSGGGSRHDFG